MIQLEGLSTDEYKVVLEKLHKCVLKIAVEIKRICNENQIKYFIIGGTLLGAVRHQGFIPWDDDMDIGFLRDDYSELIRLCKSQLKDEFQLVDTDLDNYGLPFAKIQLKGTLFLEAGATEYECGNGIYVDIFPIDRIPDDQFKRRIHEQESMLLRYALIKKCGYKDLGATQGIKRIAANFYSDIHTKKRLLRTMDKVARKYNQRKTKNFYNTGSAYRYGKEIFPEETLIGELPDISFDGVLFKCPKNKEKVLTLLYGDYMKLPPEDKRYNRHGIIAVDFGNYD